MNDKTQSDENAVLFRLTKKLNDNNYVCFAEGTNMCLIHNGAGTCRDCKVVKALFAKLGVYEDILDEEMQ